MRTMVCFAVLQPYHTKMFGQKNNDQIDVKVIIFSSKRNQIFYWSIEHRETALSPTPIATAEATHKNIKIQYSKGVQKTKQITDRTLRALF